MEHITMITETMSLGPGLPSEFSRLWIGQEEMPIQGRTLSQHLEEMYRQGWHLTIACAKPHVLGTLCEYEFQRPKALATM
jgi:hypothetical protein